MHRTQHGNMIASGSDAQNEFFPKENLSASWNIT